MNKKGLFVVFEGVDGSGKTTTLNKVKNKLENKYGKDKIVCVKDFDSTKLAKQVSGIIFEKQDYNLDCFSEFMLICSMRNQLLKEVIIPSLKKGKVVLCDRFLASTYVYQGVIGGMNLKILNEIETNFINEINEVGSILNIFLNVNKKVIIKRLQERKNKDNLDYFALNHLDQIINAYCFYFKDKTKISNKSLFELNNSYSIKENVEKIIKRIKLFV